MSVRVSPSEATARGTAENYRRLLWAGIIGPLIFVTVFTSDGLLKPGYSAYAEAISYLEVGANGWIQQANFALLGVLLLVFLAGYVWRMGPVLGQGWLYAATAWLAISDLGWIMAGLFTPNPFRTPQYSGHGVLHQIASATVFLPLAIACLILGAKLIRTRQWRGYGWYCLIFGLVQLVYPIGTLAYLINPTAFGNVNGPNDGVIQRIVVVGGPVTWYVVSAIIALRWTKRASGQVAAIV
jgi:hypothetical membrane protein